mgnify:FL=1
MNYQIILNIVGLVLQFEAAFMSVPFLTALIYKEEEALIFIATAIICLVVGYLLKRKTILDFTMLMKDGCIAVSLSWIAISVFGAIPFWASGCIPSFIDAIFETVSGFTTTGASILTEVESLPRSIIIWRSFTHWIGGMGMLVFLLTLIKMPGGSHMNLMKAESPGPIVGRLVPRVQTTAIILYGIYLAMTVVEGVLLIIARMPVFDAICTAFGTAGTGGFGILNDSMASYSPAIQYIVTIFMIAFGVNFSVYYLMLIGKLKDAVKSEEVRWYFIIIAVAVGIITWNILGMYSSLEEAFRMAAFQVGSIITTTGFATTNFDLWPEVSKMVLLALMFVGACAGSTGGGIKVSRFIVLIRYMSNEVKQYFHPNLVRKVTLDGKAIPNEVTRNTSTYVVVYALIYALSLFIIAFDGKDFVTNFSAVAATFNNIGPGLGIVGPAGNFSSYSDLSKVVLTFDMLAGRLEIFPMLILFSSESWKGLMRR